MVTTTCFTPAPGGAAALPVAACWVPSDVQALTNPPKLRAAALAPSLTNVRREMTSIALTS